MKISNGVKQKLKDLFIYALALGSLALPFLASAQSVVQQGLQTSGLSGLFGSGGLTSNTSLPQLIAYVIQLMLLFAGGVAIVFVIIGGYQYITSGGNEESAEKGRKTLTNAIIGVIIIILSYTIITVIANLVASPYGQGF
jgi:hypothetical protein